MFALHFLQYCGHTSFPGGVERNTEESSGGRMDQPLNQNDFNCIENQLLNSVEMDRRHWRVNTVKCDAIHTAKTYEEFADRVAAAHLRPLDKCDYKKKSTPGWNQYAAKEKNQDE